MLVTERTYEEMALDALDRQWELHRGVPREKPAMSAAHNRAIYRLDRQLILQLDPASYEIRTNSSRVRRTEQNYYIPDLAVVPAAYVASYAERPDALEVYDRPLPLVVEVWSPSTGDYDVDAKLPEYQRRGDAEIWRLHPFEPSLRVWRRRPDGGYQDVTYAGGVIEPLALPGVVVDLDRLFGG